MNKLMLVDGNAIGFASQNGPVLTHEGQQVQALFGFLNTLRRLRVRYHDYTPIVLWDGGNNWRREIYPEYKANRTADPKMVVMREHYRAMRPAISAACVLLGHRTLVDDASEADDLAGYYVRTLKSKVEHILLVTGDRDWLQLVSPSVSWQDTREEERYCTWENFAEYTGVATPRQFLEMKALMGDTSDNIKGVGGIGETYAKELMFQFGSVDGLIKATIAGNGDVGVGKRKKVRELATGETDARDRFDLNLRLMNLIEAPTPKAPNLRTGSFHKEGFLALCRRYNFASILRDFTQWTQPFIATRS